MQITLWYGHAQRFGHLGLPQRWINVLGTVTGGPPPVSLTCSLNGGPPQSLNLGPDGLRLLRPGDFNAEIACDALRSGPNDLLLVATGASGVRTAETVTITFEPNRRWPLPYRVHWREVDHIPDVVQVVEGLWDLTPAGIRPRYPGYDRLIAIGDRSWTSYEVQARVTFHTFARTAAGHPLGGFGFLLRWTGHYADGSQPSGEWRPSGAIGWYRARWEDDPARVRCLNISDGVIKDTVLVEAPPLDLVTGEPYVFRCGVQARPGATSRYTLQVWRERRSDDVLCDLTTYGREGESPQGALLCIALHDDVTIGDLEIAPQ
jgi:hypothetical protein